MTPAGEAALAMALRMDSVLEDLRFTFSNGTQANTAKLRIGAIESVIATHLPDVIAGFLRQHPSVDVSIHSSSSATILKQIRDGDLDLGFVSRAPKIPNLREVHAFTDELVIVAPPAVRSLSFLFSKEGAKLKVLVQRLGCSYTERMLNVLAESAPRPYRQMELGTLEGILGFVELGLGIAAMPRGFIRSLSIKRNLSLLELPASVRKLKTYLVSPAAEDGRVVVNKFTQFCRDEIR